MPKKKTVIEGELVLFDDPQLLRLEERIATHRINTITEILETGKLLAMAHEVLAEKGKNGKFGAWVQDRCGISRPTADKYIKAFSLFGTHEGIRGHVSLSAIEYLAGDNIPEEAPAKVIDEAQRGTVIWLPQAKAITKSVSVSSDEETTSENVKGGLQIPDEQGGGESKDDSDTEDDALDEETEEETEEEYEDDLTADEIVKTHNSLIECYCRTIMKQAKDTRPDVQWLDHKGRWDGAMRKIKQGLDTIRSAKAVVCPKCEGVGVGCAACDNFGYLPKMEAESFA